MIRSRVWSADVGRSAHTTNTEGKPNVSSYDVYMQCEYRICPDGKLGGRGFPCPSFFPVRPELRKLPTRSECNGGGNLRREVKSALVAEGRWELKLTRGTLGGWMDSSDVYLRLRLWIYSHTAPYRCVIFLAVPNTELTSKQAATRAWQI